MNREALAWAAGFVDGEGSFHWNCTGRARNYGIPRFSVAQVDAEPIERMHDLFPFLSLTISDVKHHSGNHDQWVLYTNGYEKVQALVAQLWPWLSGFKRDDASRVLTMFREQSRVRLAS